MAVPARESVKDPGQYLCHKPQQGQVIGVDTPWRAFRHPDQRPLFRRCHETLLYALGIREGGPSMPHLVQNPGVGLLAIITQSTGHDQASLSDPNLPRAPGSDNAHRVKRGTNEDQQVSNWRERELDLGETG